MKKFLCYDTEAAARGEINVDSRGMLKPTTPSAQSDWNVTDSADPAFIKNKPFGDVPGVKVFDGGNRTSVETNADGYQVFTFTGTVDMINSGDLVNIQIDTKTYENITATQTYTSSSSWEYTFDTAGLPFTVKIEGGYGMSSTVKVTILDGSYINFVVITDMSRNSQVKLSAEYINTSHNTGGLGLIFPTCGVNFLSGTQDKMHLVYNDSTTQFDTTYDTYLKSSGGKIFKLVVDDSGNLSATEV